MQCNEVERIASFTSHIDTFHIIPLRKKTSSTQLHTIETDWAIIADCIAVNMESIKKMRDVLLISLTLPHQHLEEPERDGCPSLGRSAKPKYT